MSIRADLARLWTSRGFRKLTTTRLLSQAGDGMFQVGIATAFFFDPTAGATPNQIALGFTVLLAPFTIIGPFVGPLIDRWQRQQILLVGNIVRLTLVATLVLSLIGNGPTWILYLLALLSLSINRFLLAAMAAGIPHVVPPAQLLTANSVLPTLGSIAAAIGGASGAIVTFAAPAISDNSLAATSLVAAGVCFGISALAAAALGQRELGPTHPLARLDLRKSSATLVRELVAGVQYLRGRQTPWYALLVMGGARLLYGLMFVAAILISRHLLTPDTAADADGGLAQFSVVLGFAAAGFGLAAVVTPMVPEKYRRGQWIVICLLIGAVGQSALALSAQRWALYAAAIVISFGIQSGKIAVDTIVQQDTRDSMRGRAFTLYDLAFNVAFISAAIIAACTFPPTGYSPLIMAGVALGYLALASWFSTTPRQPRELPTTPAEQQ